MPSAATDTAAPRSVPSSANWTVPLVTGSPPLVTVAVKVTLWPKPDGFGVAVSAVLVAAWLRIRRHQPPWIEPASPVASSNTHRLQVPLPPAPLNVDSAVAELSAGAGAGRFSVDSSAIRVGRKVPEVSEVADTWLAASSSKVRFTLLTGFCPPPSLSRKTFLVGVGPESRMSRSIGVWWESPLSSAVTLVTFPPSPETLMFDG